ncbi:DDE-type integrase/transposase/recombinase [Microbacterium sp.]|uniref:DDE-type integrase/transposase/recombinase n=1 Tax=Microbacterium sp. TaxID=51671 RepID=UPI00281226C0|nr:DDE-type integrase/transposase/recombinase [Microbacterium sp.]
MSNTWILQAGADLVYDGEAATVIEVADGAVIIRTRAGRVRRLRLVELLRPRAEGGLAHIPGRTRAEEEAAPLGVIWADATKAAQARAQERADHVREVLTGYTAGGADVAREGEPRELFHPDNCLEQRIAAKAAELGKGHRTIERWIARYREAGEAGLVDNRSAQPGQALMNFDERWVDAARDVIDEQTPESKVAKTIIIARINARVARLFGADVVASPSRSAAYKILDELTRGRATFSGSTKRKRSNANRPTGPYGRLHATRPGQYVYMDTTPLNVFAIAPVTGKWVCADLTVAMDVYSRCIVGLRLTPGSTKSVDVAGVLMEACQPFEAPPDWERRARWPYHGVPDTVVADPARIGMPRFVRAGILPETIVVDHGAPYLSEHVTSACARIGISIQPARVYQPTDKGPQERFFRTLDTFLQELPGYKGADISGRGDDPEGDAVYTVAQLEQIIREWVATVYHLRPHDSLQDPKLPGVKLSPAERYDQGLAVAGTLRMPTERSVLLELLPVVKRRFNHYGVEIHGLRYTGEAVVKYRNRARSIHTEKGRTWPFVINPDDLTQIYFRDPEDNTWHTLDWEHKGALDTPFSLDALTYAKKIAVKQGRPSQVDQVAAQLLEDWGAGRALTPAERRMSARMAALLNDREPDPDGIWSLRSIQRMLDAELAPTDTFTEELTGPIRDPKAHGDVPQKGDDDDEDDIDEPTLGADYNFEPMEMIQ